MPKILDCIYVLCISTVKDTIFKIKINTLVNLLLHNYSFHPSKLINKTHVIAFIETKLISRIKLVLPKKFLADTEVYFF